MARPAKQSRRKRGTVVDFTGIQAGGLSIPDGRYKAKIIAWEEKEGNDSGEPYVQLEWEVTSDKCNGRSIKFDNHSLQPQALPFLRTVLEALEYDIEERPDFEIDWDSLIKDETECIVETVAVPSRDDASKKFARIVGFYPVSDGGTVDDEDDDAPKAEKETRRGTRSSTKDEDDEDEPPKRRSRKDDDEDDDEKPSRHRSSKDDDDEDEPPPSSKKIKKGAKVKFKDEKNKLTKGTIDSIDGDTAVVVTADDESYEIDLDELTVIG